MSDLTDFIKTPEGVGLLSAAFGGLAGARRGQPVNTIGKAGMSGLLGYSHAQDQANALAQGSQMQTLRQMQIDSMTREAKTKELLGRSLMGGSPTPPSGAGVPTDYTGYSPEVSRAFGLTPSDAPKPSAHPPQSQKQSSYSDQLMDAAREAGDVSAFQEAMKMKLEEKKYAPKFATDVRTVSINGVPTPIQMADDGTWKPMGSGITTAEKLAFHNTGSQVVGLDPYTGAQRAGIRTTMSPDAAASNALGWANHNKPQFNQEVGAWITPPKGMKSGEVVKVEGGAPKLTEAQGKAAGFSDRMIAADKILNDPKLQDKPGGLEATFGSIPVVGNASANLLRNPGRQQFVQAEEDWVRAKLRKESGAVIGTDEMEQERKMYFPQIGDSQEVIAQKAEARQRAAIGIGREAGSGYKPPETPQLRSKQFDVDGQKVIGSLGSDGNYYVTKGGKKFRVEE